MCSCGVGSGVTSPDGELGGTNCRPSFVGMVLYRGMTKLQLYTAVLALGGLRRPQCVCCDVLLYHSDKDQTKTHGAHEVQRVPVGTGQGTGHIPSLLKNKYPWNGPTALIPTFAILPSSQHDNLPSSQHDNLPSSQHDNRLTHTHQSLLNGHECVPAVSVTGCGIEALWDDCTAKPLLAALPCLQAR